VDFGAPWSKGVKIVTALTLVALLAVQGALVLNEMEREVSVIVGALSILLVVVCFLLAPTGYGVDSTHVYIRRQLLPVSLRFNDILEARRLSSEETSFTIRVFGSGGLFGFFGYFYNQKLGWQRWYATRRGDLVGILTHSHGWLMLTPDDPEKFVAMLKKRL
jgi:hypothetical protein